jgi:hypothetical protein
MAIVNKSRLTKRKKIGEATDDVELQSPVTKIKGQLTIF